MSNSTFKDHIFESDNAWTPERVAGITKSIIIIVIAGILLGGFAAVAQLYFVALAIGAAVLVIIIAWQFEAALVLYTLAAFVPWGRTPDIAMGGSGMGKGVYVSQIMLGLLVAIWFGKYLLSALPEKREKSGFHIPLGLYLAFCIINIIHSFIFWDPAVDKQFQHPAVNFIELALRFLSAGAFAIMATTISSRKWITYIIIAFFIMAFYNLINALLGNPIKIMASWWPFLIYFPAAYCCIQALNPKSKISVRILAALALLAAVYVVVFRSVSWVSGWLGLIPAIGVVIFIMNRKLFAGLALASIAAVAIFWPVVHEAVLLESEKGGDFDRFHLFRGGFKYATTFPLGVGLGNYMTYNAYHYGEKWGTTSYTSAHGTYSQHLAETGIPGTVLFISILICGGRWIYKNYKEMKPGRAKNLQLAIFGQLVGISIAAIGGDYIIPVYHNGGLGTFSTTIYSWIIWGLSVANVRIYKNYEQQNG